MARVTISDIALRAGLSKGAVSYALNDKPGVSEETRQRVAGIARDLGWTPSSAARSLSRSRADAIGLVLARPARMLGTEPFYMEFIAGIEDVIAARGISLMLHVVDHADTEIAIYTKWWAERRVDGILLVDLAQDDSRLAAVRRLEIPAVAVASTRTVDGFANVEVDDAAAMQEAMRYLVRLGHRRIARVGGRPQLSHTLVRDRAFRQAAGEAVLGELPIMETDFSGEAGARATRLLLTGDAPPTAIVYDNDIMAVAGLGAAHELGVVVPAEVSLLAWDDSALCEITHPPLSAMRRDVGELGAVAAGLLLEVIAGGGVQSRRAATPALFPRASTGPAPRS